MSLSLMVCLVLAFVAGGYAETIEPQRKMHRSPRRWRTCLEKPASLDITASDEIESLVNSYVMRELRALHDVVIGTEKADYALRIIAGQLEAKSGRRTGFVFSIVIVQVVNAHEDQGHA
jgi:hypothetical protein